MPESESAWEIWLSKHKPMCLDDYEGINEQALDALLSLSLQTLTVEQVMNYYNISEDRAIHVCLIANKMVSDIEEYLLRSMGYNS